MKEHIEYIATLLETFSFSLLYWSDNILTIENKEVRPLEILPTKKDSEQQSDIKEPKELVILS